MRDEANSADEPQETSVPEKHQGSYGSRFFLDHKLHSQVEVGAQQQEGVEASPRAFEGIPPPNLRLVPVNHFSVIPADNFPVQPVLDFLVLVLGFRRLVLGCIDASDSESRIIFREVSRSIRFIHVCIAKYRSK